MFLKRIIPLLLLSCFEKRNLFLKNVAIIILILDIILQEITARIGHVFEILLFKNSKFIRQLYFVFQRLTAILLF